MIAEAEIVPKFFDRFDALVDPPLPGSEQFSLQQRRASETWGAVSVDLALLQQRGIFAFAQDPSDALTPTAPLTRTTMIMKLRARFRIPAEYIWRVERPSRPLVMRTMYRLYSSKLGFVPTAQVK